MFSLQKQVQKGIAAVLSAALLLPAWTGTVLAEVPKDPGTAAVESVAAQVYGFQDTVDHWSRGAVETWSGYGVVQGYGDGLFKPDQSVTRAEFASMLQNISKYTETGDNVFSDVSAGDWYYEPVTKLSAAGVMEGSEGKAHPQAGITRQEAAVLLARAFQLKGTGSSAVFSDKPDIADWALGSVQELASRNILKGFPDGSFKPLSTLTRAEATSLFDQFLAKLYSQPGTYTGEVKGNVLVNTADVTLKDMTITGDLYIAQGVGEGEAHLDGVTVEGTVYVQGGGEHSILFNNVNVKGSLVVNKYNGKVRVVASGNTNVSVTLLESGAMLVTRELTGGGFESVTIAAEILAGQQIVLDGSFNKVTNLSETASITANGTIKELVAEVTTKLSGEAKVEKISGKESSSVTINDKPQNAGTTTSGGGSSSGGGGGGGSSTIAVTGVSLSETDITLKAGATKQLTAAVTPSNATNKAVTWSVYDATSDVVTVDNTGLVTAKAPGVRQIAAKTQDGGFEARATVTVEANVTVQQGLNVIAKLYTSDLQTGIPEFDADLLNNVKKVSITETTPSVLQDNTNSAVITANESLTETTVGHAVYAVITLTDAVKFPLQQTEGVTITVNGATYAPEFGKGLNSFAESSFLFLVDAGSPEQVKEYVIDINRAGHGHVTLKLAYVPAGVPLLTGMQSLVADKPVAGETLVAPSPIFKNGNAGSVTMKHQWYRSESSTSGYQPIDGATSETYVLKTEDEGRYIRVAAFIDGPTAGIPAVSPTAVYVLKPVSAEDVFTVVDALYLNGNTGPDNIIGNLYLPRTLSQFPGIILEWTSGDTSVASPYGQINRGNDDQTVSLTLTLSGLVTGSRTYTLTVKKLPVSTSEYIDPAFSAGYPQAYIKNGTIWVKFALNKPAEVFMLVNTSNGRAKSSVKSVLEGHAGLDSQVVYADDWPYFNITQEQIDQVQEFDTRKEFSSSSREARVEFVIRDQSGSVSPDVTTILFDRGTVQALDTSPPVAGNIYINEALDTIYVYYNETLDASSVPAASDYRLSEGKVDDVRVQNFGEAFYYDSCVILSVSGIAVEDKNSLYLAYSGSALRDASNAGNQASTIVNNKVYTVNAKLSEAVLSSDRQQMSLKVQPGWNMGENGTVLAHDKMPGLFTAVVEGKGEFVPSGIFTSSFNSSYSSITVQFNAPLPEGATTIQMKTSDLISWSRDFYPEALTVEAQEIASPGTPTAAYTSVDGKLLLTFASGYVFDSRSFSSAGLVLMADDVEYALRGQILSPVWSTQGGIANQVAINLQDKWSGRFKQAIENGAVVKIKYQKANGTSLGQLADAADALLPDFEYITVTKQ